MLIPEKCFPNFAGRYFALVDTSPAVDCPVAKTMFWLAHLLLGCVLLAEGLLATASLADFSYFIGQPKTVMRFGDASVIRYSLVSLVTSVNFPLLVKEG